MRGLSQKAPEEVPFLRRDQPSVGLGSLHLGVVLPVTVVALVVDRLAAGRTPHSAPAFSLSAWFSRASVNSSIDTIASELSVTDWR